MEFVQHLVLLLHLVGFASLLGGVIVQARAETPEVNPAMLHGVLTMLVTGVVLVVLVELGPDAESVDHVKIGVKLVVTLVLTVLIVANRRFSEIPRGLWGLIGLGALANAAVAVLWV